MGEVEVRMDILLSDHRKGSQAKVKTEWQHVAATVTPELTSLEFNRGFRQKILKTVRC